MKAFYHQKETTFSTELFISDTVFQMVLPFAVGVNVSCALPILPPAS